MANQLPPGPYDAFQISLLSKALTTTYNKEARSDDILD